MKALWVSVCVAALLWTVMFFPATAPHVSFWGTMSASALVLSVFAIVHRPRGQAWLGWSVANVVMGVCVAVLLWGVFWAGDKVSAFLFDFARPQVDLIYGIKSGTSPVLLSVLMLCLIGPAEELFWRGYVQRTLSARLSPDGALLLSTVLYALVHVASCNFMLVMAAAVAGSVWGLFYRFFPQRLSALVVSHALWDAAVFIWFPI